MRESASLIFPFRYDNENECLARAHTIEDTVLSSIRSFLITRKGSRVGSNLGSFLPELLLQGVAVSSLPGLSEELRKELENQFSGVSFLEVKLTRDLSDNVSTLKVHIKLSVPASAKILDFEMSLPSIFTQ